MQGQISTGYTVGNGAAINVPIGWYPDWVIVQNLTDADKMTMGYLGRYNIPFTSGGTTEITAGCTVKGATSGATATVETVLLYSGTWAGGDAAGFLIVRDVVGTFSSEAAYISSDDTSGADDATVTANVTFTISSDTEIAAETSNAAITRYTGSTSAAIGFTIGSTVAEEAKLLHYIAFRADERKNVVS